MGAASSFMIVPAGSHGPALPVERGDSVASIDGEVVGVAGAIGAAEFEVLTPTGVYWLSRDDVFLSDREGVVLAFGVDEVPERTVSRPDRVA